MPPMLTGDGADGDAVDGAKHGYGVRVIHRMSLGDVASRPGLPLPSSAARSRPFGRVSLVASVRWRSLRAPLARRLADAHRRVPVRHRRRGVRRNRCDHLRVLSRAGASRSARRRPRLARPGRLRRLRASPPARPGAPVRRRASDNACAPASPGTTRRSARRTRAGAPAEHARTSLRTSPGTGVRMTADTAADASGSVLRTTARGSRRNTSATQCAVAAPLRRLRRRRFPERGCSRIGRSGPPGAALGLTPDASLMQGAQGCICVASHVRTVDRSQPRAPLACRIQ